MRTNRQHEAINTLGLDRDALLKLVKLAYSNTTAARKAIAESLAAGRITQEVADRDDAVQTARRSELRTLINLVLNDEFLVAWHAAYNASKSGTTSATEVTRLYTTAEEIYERAYTTFHGTKPADKPAPKADEKASKDKAAKEADSSDPAPAPAPKADKDDGKDKKEKDDTDPAKKPAPKADDKADAPVVDVAGLAALIKSGQDECRDGFTGVNKRIDDVAKGTLPEDIAKMIRDAGAERVKAILDGTATTAGLTPADRSLLDLLHLALHPYTDAEIVDMFDALGGGNKFLGGLLRGIGRTGRPTDTHN
jgi:hypothetical protein